MKIFKITTLFIALIIISLSYDTNAQTKSPEPKSGFALTKKIIQNHLIYPEEALDKKGIPDDEKRENAIALADGSAGEAMRIYVDGAEAVKLRQIADKLIKALLSPGSDKLSFINLHQKNVKKTDELCRIYALIQSALRDVTAYKTGASSHTVYFTSNEEAEEYSLHISDKALMKANDVISELLSISDVPLNPALAATEFSSRLWDAHLI